ncbi:tryptophan halogenase family protein [Alteromonas sp. KUL49]|uniref:tryptophan halogenase family protein n=1 Tax=Alteromonas sp. KUL49 TaxID=2480798 RepID=UPI00102F066F|nr:tryptophan halogenase family protein [Alteromonas sp. KUL49]TAP42112.1 tryptophan 7-halogenase [Alteromonas sp. KUL49]GEA09694.1 tryptophan halogenase [Alteromonas sp. KUL49]
MINESAQYNVSANAVKKVVIAGGGTAGWMAATALSRLIGKSVSVTLVESKDIGIVGVGEATIPPIRTLHKLLGIDESQFMQATQATYKLGIEFENWRDKGHSYIHSFGITGRECWAGEFHHFWLRAQSLGFGGEFGDYCVELKAALENKFATSDKAPLNFAYHFDAVAYGKFLRSIAEQSGVKRIEGNIAKVNKCVERGYLTSLLLESGEVIEGDLFIDCTGFKGLLIEQALHTGYENWQHWLPCDTAMAMQTEAVEPPPPYTKSVAHTAGWRWKIPLQSRVGNGLVYCSKYMTDDEARETLTAQVTGAPINDPRIIRFTPGKRRLGWNKNCVALGLASGFIEPLESTSIHLIMTGIIRLLRNFPFDGITQSAIDEYNNKFNSEMDAILDFIVMHYKVTNRMDSPFWQHCQTMDIPKSLQHKIALFADTGRVFLDDGDIFRVDSWTQVMLGQGLTPRQYHRVADEMSTEELQRFMAGLKQHVDHHVSQLPQHSDFLKHRMGA